MRLADLAGDPLPAGGGYPLDSHGVLWAPQPADGVEVSAWVPDGGKLSLRLVNRERQTGVALKIKRTDEGAVEVTVGSTATAHRPAGSRTPVGCDGQTLEVPDEQITARLARAGGGSRLDVTLNGETISCANPLGQAVLHPTVGSGLKRVALLSAELPDRPEVSVKAPGPAWIARLLVGLLGAGLTGGAVRMALRRGSRPAAVLAPLAPLLFTAALASADMSALLQSARINADEPLSWCVGLPVTASLFIAGVMLAKRSLTSESDAGWWATAITGAVSGLFAVVAFGAWGLLGALGGAAAASLLRVLLGLVEADDPPGSSRSGRGAQVVVAGAGAAGLLVASLEPLWGHSTLFAAAAGGLFALVLWANVRVVRGFNLISLTALSLGLLLCEHSLAWTSTGNSLIGRSSRARVDDAQAADSPTRAFHSFEVLENTRAFTRYPDQDYPVEPPPPIDALRVVAFGSSSTAGAYQNDDIDDFWPADLEGLLGGVAQVINQGVGGWTSFHVRRYIETRGDLLRPDVAIFYLGHNDKLTRSVIPYKQLHARWKAGAGVDIQVSSALAGVRLYQALRHGLQGVTGRTGGAAIPLEHARENYERMIALVREGGGRVLLVTEGVSPDPSLLAEYGEMLQSLAEGPDVAYLDGAAVLDRPSFKPHFIDDCHLSQTGHEALAQAIADALWAEGWVARVP